MCKIDFFQLRILRHIFSNTCHSLLGTSGNFTDKCGLIGEKILVVNASSSHANHKNTSTRLLNTSKSTNFFVKMEEHCDEDSDISTYFDEMLNSGELKVPFCTYENSILKVMEECRLLNGCAKDLNFDQYTSLCQRLFKVRNYNLFISVSKLCFHR